MKRMIDNKEFEALKSDVTTLKQEATEIPKAKDKGMYYALEEPTENDDVFTYSNLTIANINTDIPLKVGDLIMSFDATDLTDIKSANMWKIDEIGDDSVEVVLVGKVGGGGGKQLYQHNIVIDDNNANNNQSGSCLIINDSNEKIDTQAKLIAYLSSKGLTSTSKKLPFTFIFGASNNNQYICEAVYTNSNKLYWQGHINNFSSFQSGLEIAIAHDFNDEVIPL